MTQPPVDQRPYSDPRHLMTGQYRDSTNLNARAELHLRFGKASVGWFHWVLDCMADLPPDARIVELGCGPGLLWRNNADRVPRGWRADLTDLSQGMVDEARLHLVADGRFTTAVAAAGHLPFADETYDAAVANHMLYHVPDLGAALADLRRVLRPGGRLFAATNGSRHLSEMHDLVRQVSPASIDPFGSMAAAFRLDDGPTLLAPWFDDVTVYRHDSGLVVTEAEPLVAYVASVSHWLDVDGLARLRRLVDEQLEHDGEIHITRDSGLLMAQRS